MKINSSVTIRKAVYTLNAKQDISVPLIEISGENIVVDFNKAELRGSNDKHWPNEFYGLAILIKNGKNITIKNLNARGYKVALMARNVEGLTIDHCDFSYNYRQQLNSTQQKEDLSDWMSYHHNEKDEWLRYGAAIYLRKCDKANIYDNIVTGGQCALMMTECDDGKIHNNDFSFNSAIGIGMYRSSRNKVMYNRLDFNVRGYSHGVYNRGQDSAGILVFEQCNKNIFAYNSATHSGDGFFLWAGQTTMDTGEGGCNDNLLFKNNFSYTPTNGIEVTFSRNIILQNELVECDHGIWGGYSFGTLIKNNRFAFNRIGIAIEHGQNDTIYGNYFRENKEAIRLWARKAQPADWGYAQKRDTRSRDYQIVLNKFTGDSLVYNIANTLNVKLDANSEDKEKQEFKIDSITWTTMDTTLQSSSEKAIEDLRAYDSDFSKKRYQIRITEWGPYDFRYPILWLTNPVDTSGLLKFELLGPKGKWRLVGSRGIEGVSKTSGTFPDSVTARKLSNNRGDVFIGLEFTGNEITAQLGDKVPKDKPFHFSFHDGTVPIQWRLKWFTYDSASNPIKKPELITRLSTQPPFQQQLTKDLHYAWWGGLGGATKFLTIAESDIDVLPGKYQLSTSWDDAVRIYIDGRLIVDEWNPSKYTFDESPNKKLTLNLSGRHHLRVEHVELGGFATLIVKLKEL